MSKHIPIEAATRPFRRKTKLTQLGTSFPSLLWILSTVVSFYTLKYYHANGDLPGYERLDGGNNANIDPDKAAFSMAPHDEEAYAPIHNSNDDDDHHNSTPYNADAYGSVNSNTSRNNNTTMFDSETAYGSHHQQNDPFADSTYGGAGAHVQYSDTSYGGARVASPYGGGVHTGASNPYAAPTAEEDYDDRRPAKFPAANYDRTMH